MLDVWSGARGALTLAQWREVVQTMTLLLSPMAPHVASEVWELLGQGENVLDAPWPGWDDELAADEVVTVVVQVNGKLRERLQVPVDAEKDDVLAQARAAENAARFLEGKQLVKGLRPRQARQLRRQVELRRGRRRGRRPRLGCAGRQASAACNVSSAACSCASTPWAASAVTLAIPRMNAVKASTSVGDFVWTIALASLTRLATSPAMSAMSCVTCLSRPMLMSAARSWMSGLCVSALAWAMNLAAAVASLKVSHEAVVGHGKVGHRVGDRPLQDVPLVLGEQLLARHVVSSWSLVGPGWRAYRARRHPVKSPLRGDARRPRRA